MICLLLENLLINKKSTHMGLGKETGNQIVGLCTPRKNKKHKRQKATHHHLIVVVSLWVNKNKQNRWNSGNQNKNKRTIKQKKKTFELFYLPSGAHPWLPSS